MTLNERILDFLDGSLPAEDEAELLHTLSVSPEQRGLLRSFMLQGALLARDAKSLTVPYAAEQRLWARMDRVLPITATEDAGTALVPLPLSIVGDAGNAGFFARALSGTSAMLVALTLLAGIGIGYFAGHSQTTVGSSLNNSAPVSSTVSASPHLAVPSQSYETHGSYGIHRINGSASHVASALPVTDQQESAPLVPPSALSSDDNTVPITPVAAVNTPAIAPSDIGGDGVGIKPMLHYVRAPREENGSLLSRFEFRYDQSFGRQYPNNVETTPSQPDLTNLSLTTFFQVFPHSNLFWAGVSGGFAKIALKQLFVPTNSPQNILSSDTASFQTRYGAVLAELRLPAFDMTDFTFTAGYGFASLGQMMFGEIGLHGDLSNEAGYHCGIRVLRFAYNLNAEEANAKASAGNSSLIIPTGVTTVGPSINAELNMGLFFHF